MMKKVIALLLCFVMLVPCLAACSHGENDKGAFIRMYLTEPVYDLDPLQAFDNEAALQIVSLLYEGLFYADENGKPKKALVDDYKFYEDEDEDEYYLQLELKTTSWSDGVQLTANDVQYAFHRLFDTDTSHPAVAMLYDIKNARDIVKGDQSVDHLGVEVVNNTEVLIHFEGPVDKDTFLSALCSPALYPLRYDVVDYNEDWGKKASTIVCSGPFMVRSMDFDEADGFVLERNAYYYRNREKDKIDKYVNPYRIVIDYSTDAADQFALFNSDEKGALYYFGHIPLSLRGSSEYADILKKVDVTDAPSTHVYYLNQNAEIGGDKLFADADVRKALSLAIDREAIVEALVYARAATGLVPYTVRNRPDRKTQFRKKAEEYITSTANFEQAKELLQEAGIRPSSYSFSITVASYDEEHMATAELVKAAWASLGFKVSIRALGVTEIKDAEGKKTGMFESKYKQALQTGDFEVIALDLVATSPDAFSYLAPFAKEFSGNGYNMTTYDLNPHITGYDSEAYNDKIEAAFGAEKIKDRAELLHEAEEILMDDMPVIPIVFNQNTSLRSRKLKRLDNSFFCNAVFTDAKLSGYWKIALRDEFVTEEESTPADE